ncbi:MAG: zinc-ribbon domain-containing protein, partial [Proteobacteria bacterium]|nr:zinc-ribbon domain-containing protein [Pseudomonadota bacterium]
MKVHCQTCGTDFRLDDGLIPPEGAWVRCSQCGDVFQVVPEAQEKAPAPAETTPQEPEQTFYEAVSVALSQAPEPPAAPREPAPNQEAGFWAEEATASTLDLSMMARAEQERARKRADFGLEQRPEIAQRPPRGPLFKAVFWPIAILLLAAITALGSVLIMARLGVGHEVVDRAARLPGMAPLLGRSAKGGSQATNPAVVRMSLVEVKSFNRINETSGRIFVIQGKVVN